MAPITTVSLWKGVLEIADRHRIMTFGGYPGSLMEYSRYFSDVMQRVATILDKVLRGADPADIPFELPDRILFSLNRATARRIGIEIPQDMLLRATEVIDG